MKTQSKPNPSIFLSLLWNPDRPDPEFIRRLNARQGISMMLPDLVKQVSETNDRLKGMNGLFSELRESNGGYYDNRDDRKKLAKLLEQFGEEVEKLQSFLKQGNGEGVVETR